MSGPALSHWMALAYRLPVTAQERREIALGPGPDTLDFPPDILARERQDLEALEELGVALVTLRDERYPARLRDLDDPPLLLHVAGRPELLSEDGAGLCAGVRDPALHEALDAGSRTVLLLSKGMLKARNLVRGLSEPIADGSLAVLSAEPPRA
ncbi:MAG: hypothetical protein ACE5JG_09730, partial [Planctomycetota bacterium]